MYIKNDCLAQHSIGYHANHKIYQGTTLLPNIKAFRIQYINPFREKLQARFRDKPLETSKQFDPKTGLHSYKGEKQLPLYFGREVVRTTITGDHLWYKQKPIYLTIFTHNIWSY